MQPLFSIFTKAKHKHPSGNYAFISSFIVTFTVISMVVLWPVLNRKEDIEEILKGQFEKEMVAVGDQSFQNSSNLGYELLDNGTIFHMWNNHDSYYFNRSNGVQFGNHYQEYWTHNVLMLGYYAGDTWNLLYRVDELSGFTEVLDAITEDYINITLWKDLSYNDYDFRLALRYHLRVNDSDLTIIPYIKNLGIAIPFDIGFGWEMKDIQIDNNIENDQFRLEDDADNTQCTVFSLHNDSLDWSNNNITQRRNYGNASYPQNDTYVPMPIFYLDNTNEYGIPEKTLYLKWNHSLNYKLQVKHRVGQYNAPVTLFINAGTLDVGQEKSTELQWYDADVVWGTAQDMEAGEGLAVTLQDDTYILRI